MRPHDRLKGVAFQTQMEEFFPTIHLMYPNGNLAQEIERSFAREFGGLTLKQMRPGAYKNIKNNAPVVFAECKLFPEGDDKILIMTPDETLMTTVSSWTYLTLIERYYRANYATARAFIPPRIKNSEPPQDTTKYQQLVGATVEFYDDVVEINIGWWFAIVELDVNIKRLLQSFKVKKVAPGVYAQNLPRHCPWDQRAMFATRGLTCVGYDSAENFIKANDELLRIFDTLHLVREILPQPIAEEIHEFFH